MSENKEPILYIDDELGNLKGFKASFLHLYEIYIAKNTEEAQEILKNIEIKVILIDYKMPNEDGISFILKIKNQYPHAIKILITAFAETEMAIKTINSHSFYSIIQKPWDYEQLSLIIKNAIDKYNLEKDKRELVLKLAESLQKEKRANQVKEVFLKNISHELRTPLNGILGFSELILNDIESSQLKEKLGIIIKSGERLFHTMQSILDSSLIITRQYKYFESVFNLKDTISNIINEKQKKYQPKSKVDFQYDSTNEYPCVNDLEKTTVILEKIIDNAFKFSQSTKQIKVILNKKNHQSYYNITVENNGDKINKEDYNNLFESFMNVDNSFSKKHEGIGLGLFIAKSYAEFLGGKLWIKEDEKMNVFCINIKKNYSQKI